MEVEYRGLKLRAPAEDPEHLGYFEYAGKGVLAVQRWVALAESLGSNDPRIPLGSVGKRRQQRRR